MSNTELRKAAEARKKEKKQETKTKHFLKLSHQQLNLLLRNLQNLTLFFASVSKNLCTLYTINTRHDKDPKVCEPCRELREHLEK